MDKKQAFLLSGIVVVIIGIVLTIIGFNTLGNAKESLQWPTIQGQITTSEMDIRKTKAGRKEYRPKILYRYTVAGLVYTSNKVTFINTMSKKAQDIRAILQRYEVGTEVTVHYNPHDPELSVLEPGVTFGAYVPLVLGIIFFMAGSGFIIFVLSSSKLKTSVFSMKGV